MIYTKINIVISMFIRIENLVRHLTIEYGPSLLMNTKFNFH